MELPYRAEYAKSGRASCRGCKSPIGKDVLRLAVMVQSPMFDGRTPQWYHFQCFFSKQRPKTADDIEHLESLRWEDQQKIKDHIQAGSSIIVPDKKGKKRIAPEKKLALKDFTIEYSKSSRAICRGCEQKIMKEEVRISKKDFETEVGKKYGGQDMWHHLACFAKLRSELGYLECADKLPGFKSLEEKDRKEAISQIPAIKQEDAPAIKKVKTEAGGDGMSEEEMKMKEENKIMYKYRDQLKQLSKNELIELFNYNNQETPVGEDRMLDRLSDIMTFGALNQCEQCEGGQYVFNKAGYVCTGNLSEWSKCNNITKTPTRRPFKVPKDLAEEYSFLKKYKYVPRTRTIRDIKPSVMMKIETKDDPDGSLPKVERQRPALYGMEFVIIGRLKQNKDDIKKKITTMGGKVVTKIKRSVMAIISTEADVEKMGSRISEAQMEDIHVVSEDFLDEAKDYVGKIPELVLKKNICSWGSDPNSRLPVEESKSSKSKSYSRYTSAIPSKIKLKLKGGGAVDPDSGLEDVAHVYQKGPDKYTVVLAKTDIQKQQNSYYKLQLLVSDRSSKYWVFRSWGRIGTTIGGNKVENMDSLNAAISHFCKLYEEKTGNEWENRDHFMKVPGCFYPIDVDYGEDEAASKLEISNAPSNLPDPVQDLVRLIFDVQSMKKVMLEFELDTEKMPLGKLSKSQIQKAYGVLSELQRFIEGKKALPHLIDASNRFYTFIPHSFGVDNPPVIDNEEMIKQKVEMLDSLMEMEIAYNMMKSVGSHNDLDTYYAQLKAEIGLLDGDSEEYQLIQEYVRNTHAETHSNYELVVQQIHTVKRHGEEMRYKPFRKLHNRKLLWHGSRLTNFAGILSQGLRIAPPEAPMTGYMFGKGIYFADMVSKSANYCCTSPMSPTGLLLLCEVALGNMHECTKASYIEKLPKGKHSTKGIGKTQPHPEQSKFLNDVEIPLGKATTNKDINSALLYNEYIVYDVAQVHAKYLVKVNFKYKY